MENVFSNSPPEPTRFSDTSEQMPDFNNLFQEGVPIMMRVTDDLHRMVLLQSSNIRGLQNMMTGLLSIIGIFIFFVLALLTIIGILIFFILKYRNAKQKQRRRSNHGKYGFKNIRSEHSSINNRYMNENSDTHSDGSSDDILMCGECRFRTNDINEFGDHKSRKCSNITKAPYEPKSIQCCENTIESSWKLLQHLTDKHNLNLYRDASKTDDSHEISREMLCNENSPISYDSTDAHEMSKDNCNGETVDEEKQTYTYDKKPIFPTTTTSTTSGGFNGLNKNKISTNNITLNKASNNKIGTTKQTISNQHTTNFIVCSLDSLKSFDG